MATKTEETKASNAAAMRRVRAAKTKVASAIPHVEMGETLFFHNGVQMTQEEMIASIKASIPKHPWLGLLAHIGCIAVGFATTMIACNAIVGLIAGGTSSLLILGLALVAYIFIGCLGIILTMKYSSAAGDYAERHGLDQITSTVKGWFTRKEINHA